MLTNELEPEVKSLSMSSNGVQIEQFSSVLWNRMRLHVELLCKFGDGHVERTRRLSIVSEKLACVRTEVRFDMNEILVTGPM